MDVLCGNPKYFDGASSLVWDLNNSHWHYKLLSFQIAHIYRTSQRASKLATREGHICEFLKILFFDEFWHSCPQCVFSGRAMRHPQVLWWHKPTCLRSHSHNTNYCHSELLTYTKPPKGQVNWPPETGIFASFLKITFMTNFDIVVHSVYLVDALCGTPKYFDGASSLVIDLKISHWYYKLLSFWIVLIQRNSQRASKLTARDGYVLRVLFFGEFWHSCP